jgi:hypothetical protein
LGRKHDAAQRSRSVTVAKHKFFAGLPPQDQKIDFALVENGSSVSGGRQAADFDSLRDQIVADASDDVPDHAAKALKGLSSLAAGSAWSAPVLGLFKLLDPSGPNPDSSKTQTAADPQLPASYQPGGIFDQVT